MYIILISVFIILILMLLINNLKIKIIFNEKALKIFLFGIPIFIKRGIRLREFFRNKIIKPIEENKSNLELNKVLYQNIKFEKILISGNTIIKNQIAFSTFQLSILNMLKHLYPKIANKIPNLNIKILNTTHNKFDITIYTFIPVIKILFAYLRERKIKDVKKRNQRNA